MASHSERNFFNPSRLGLRAGLILALGAAGAVAAPGAAQAASPCVMNQLSLRLPTDNPLTLKDLREIQTLRARYTYALDATISDPRRIEELLSLFADDGCADYESFGFARGKPALRTFFTVNMPSIIAWTFHTALNPVLDVGLINAYGTWYFNARAVFKANYAAGPQAFFGSYEEEYVRTLTGWKFRVVLAHFSAPPTGP